MIFIPFLSGIILGASGTSTNRLIFIFRVIISSYASFLLLKLKYPLLVLWRFNDIKDENLINLVTSDYFIWGIFFAILCFCLFYWAIPRILKKITSRYFESKIKPFYSQINESERTTFYKNRFLKGVIKGGSIILSVRSPIRKIKEDEEITYTELINTVTYSISTVLNLIICVLFVFNIQTIWSYIISILILTISIAIMVYIPHFLYLKKEIMKTIIDKINNEIQ
ncbi:MAG TPA: hypothetical protein VK718_09165 [Ferruginibacter sp.]|nr:hypothetical protein [Ferruginibacter sp.]